MYRPTIEERLEKLEADNGILEEYVDKTLDEIARRLNALEKEDTDGR